jgi:hypothetical protein
LSLRSRILVPNMTMTFAQNIIKQCPYSEWWDLLPWTLDDTLQITISIIIRRTWLVALPAAVRLYISTLPELEFTYFVWLYISCSAVYISVFQRIRCKNEDFFSFKSRTPRPCCIWCGVYGAVDVVYHAGRHVFWSCHTETKPQGSSLTDNCRKKEVESNFFFRLGNPTCLLLWPKPNATN